MPTIDLSHGCRALDESTPRGALLRTPCCTPPRPSAGFRPRTVVFARSAWLVRCARRRWRRAAAGGGVGFVRRRRRPALFRACGYRLGPATEPRRLRPTGECRARRSDGRCPGCRSRLGLCAYSGRSHVRGVRADFPAIRSCAFAEAPDCGLWTSAVNPRSRRLGAEQSNSSVLVGEQVMLKIYRRLERGIQPRRSRSVAS